MDTLPTIWFIVIAFFWIGYLFLEGFDLGVGMLMKIFARDESDRRVLLATIGPVWDGNEVWLVTAAAAMFAAFPLWYASLFSAMYIPLVYVLFGLIFRAVSIEYRGKGTTDRWRNTCDWGIAGGSAVAALGIGAALALTTTGLPLNENGDRVGGAFAWLSGYAVLGGLAIVGFSLVHSLAFITLKTDGPIRIRARKNLLRWLPIGLAPMVAWVLVVQDQRGSLASWLLTITALAGALIGWVQAKRESEGWSFAGLAVFIAAGAAAIFTAVFPVVLPSTLNSAWDLTVANASSSDYTLTVMSVVACFGVPLVIGYQAWTYWVFRKRISAAMIPDVHEFPAVHTADKS